MPEGTTYARNPQLAFELKLAPDEVLYRIDWLGNVIVVNDLLRHCNCSVA